jgi:hypothetical protein
MAVVTLSIPDDIYEKLIEKHNAASPNKAAVDLIKRFIDFGPKSRTLVLKDEHRSELERLYGKPIDHTEMRYFLDWIRQRALVKVGECEVVLNAGQIKRANSLATFYGQPESKWMADRVQQALIAVLGH